VRNLIKLILNAGILSIISFYELPYHPIKAKDNIRISANKENILNIDAAESLTLNTNIKIGKLSRAIEKALNSRDINKLTEFLERNLLMEIEQKFSTFIQEFPNAKWVVKPQGTLKDKRHVMTLSVTAQKKKDFHSYKLEAKQKLALDIKEGKVKNYEIIDEYSILKTTNQPIDISLEIPSTALTGSWYEIDIIINKPLESSIIAGSLMLLEESQKNVIFKDSLELKPMGSGGLFKLVKAPLNPGIQTWAALIAHPDGIISITKRVRIISESESIDL